MENPYVHAAASRLQRFLGPSCLISLVLYAILIILFKRWVHLPPAGLVMLLMVVWGIVLGIGVRFRNPNPDDDEAAPGTAQSPGRLGDPANHLQHS